MTEESEHVADLTSLLSLEPEDFLPFMRSVYLARKNEALACSVASGLTRENMDSLEKRARRNTRIMSVWHYAAVPVFGLAMVSAAIYARANSDAPIYTMF